MVFPTVQAETERRGMECEGFRPQRSNMAVRWPEYRSRTVSILRLTGTGAAELLVTRCSRRVFFVAHSAGW